MREYIDGYSLANEARMNRSQFSGVFIFVEGASDKKIYSLVTDHEATEFLVSHGKKNACKAVEILNLDNSFTGALAIVDADFDRVAKTPVPGNVFITDYHDLECMMIASPALDRVIEEFGEESRVEEFRREVPVISSRLASVAFAIGCLRFVSLQRDLALRFEGLRFTRFLTNDVDVDCQKLLNEIVNHSQRHGDRSLIEELLSEELANNHDCWQMSCGHDILEVLAYVLRKKLSGKNKNAVNVEVLAMSLRLAYGARFLRDTKLFELLSDWEKSHPGLTLTVEA